MKDHDKMSEWMKVMLEEIASKQAEERAARSEHERRTNARVGHEPEGEGRRPADDPASG